MVAILFYSLKITYNKIKIKEKKFKFKNNPSKKILNH